MSIFHELVVRPLSDCFHMSLQVLVILSEFEYVFQHFNSIGMYDIVYDTGTSLAVQVLAFDNVNLKT